MHIFISYYVTLFVTRTLLYKYNFSLYQHFNKLSSKNCMFKEILNFWFWSEYESYNKRLKIHEASKHWKTDLLVLLLILSVGRVLPPTRSLILFVLLYTLYSEIKFATGTAVSLKSSIINTVLQQG